MSFSRKHFLNRIDVQKKTGHTDQEIQVGILAGTFPKPDYLCFGHQARWRRQTILDWMKQQTIPMHYDCLTARK